MIAPHSIIPCRCSLYNSLPNPFGELLLADHLLLTPPLKSKPISKKKYGAAPNSRLNVLLHQQLHLKLPSLKTDAKTFVSSDCMTWKLCSSTSLRKTSANGTKIQLLLLIPNLAWTSSSHEIVVRWSSNGTPPAGVSQFPNTLAFWKFLASLVLCQVRWRNRVWCSWCYQVQVLAKLSTKTWHYLEKRSDAGAAQAASFNAFTLLLYHKSTKIGEPDFYQCKW